MTNYRLKRNCTAPEGEAKSPAEILNAGPICGKPEPGDEIVCDDCGEIFEFDGKHDTHCEVCRELSEFEKMSIYDAMKR